MLSQTNGVIPINMSITQRIESKPLIPFWEHVNRDAESLSGDTICAAEPYNPLREENGQSASILIPPLDENKNSGELQDGGAAGDLWRR